MIFSILLILNLIYITYQDFKERKVYLFSLLTAAILAVICFYKNTLIINIILHSTLLNLSFLLIILLILYMYSKLRLRKKISETIGLGDILFFLILATGFPTFTFLTIFSSSLVFSFILFIILAPKLTNKTVPLAGLQSLFLVIVILLNNVFKVLNLYAM